MAENITYAEMTLTTGKGKGPEKTNTVLPQDENLDVTYAAVKTLPGKKKKSSARQKGQFEKNTCVIVGGDPEPIDCKQRLYQGRRCHVILVTFLVALCLVIVITTITRCVSCLGDSSRSGYILGPSSTAASSSPCSDPWILITNKCYFFSENKKTRRESEEDCEKRGSRLATVKEGTILKLVAITEQEFWIGLEALGSHHRGVWSGRWADGSTVNVTEGTGTCAKIKSELSLHSCMEELHWICERDVPAP
ncbi:early activation antigen CD69-like [Eleutherodactylus coqui]|uniref:early activation antigen CD69-like n=1 Tax=Eleutherodactylus coqui TaxID=57060 RepID=UPI003461DF54